MCVCVCVCVRVRVRVCEKDRIEKVKKVWKQEGDCNYVKPLHSNCYQMQSE